MTSPSPLTDLLLTLPAAFAFSAPSPDQIATPFTFAVPPTSPRAGRAPKRARSPASSADGNPRPKKRRLRRALVTSRLSRPFAEPPTYIGSSGYNGGGGYIGSRGAFVAARLAFQRRVGRSLLRRAAIENWGRVRRGGQGPGILERAETEMRMGMPGQEQKEPAGVSNYLAIDAEDSPFDDGGWSDAGEEEMELDGQGRPGRLFEDVVVPEQRRVAMRDVGLDDPAARKSRNRRPYWEVLANEDEAREVSVAPFARRMRLV